MCQTKLQTPSLTNGKHVIWLQREVSYALFLCMSLYQSLSLFQSSIVEQNVRPQSGKRQYVLASRLDFDAAQHPALNQWASLCSGLTKMYPEQQKKQMQQQCPSQWGLPAALLAVFKKSISEVRNKTWWTNRTETEQRSFPFELKRSNAAGCPSFFFLQPWWLCKCSC